MPLETAPSPVDTYDIRDIDTISEREIVTFINNILSCECDMRVRRQLESSVARFVEHFDAQTCLFMALYDHDKLCALLGVDHLNDHTAVLKWIFVNPDHRQNGLGSHLIDTAIDFATQAGYQILMLCTATQKMDAAHRLYHKKGFAFKQNVTFWRKPMQILERVLQ